MIKILMCLMALFCFTGLKSEEISETDSRPICDHATDHNALVTINLIKEVWCDHYEPNAQFPCLQAYFAYCTGIASGHGVFFPKADLEALCTEFEEFYGEVPIFVGKTSQGLLKFMLGSLLSEFLDQEMNSIALNMMLMGVKEMFDGMDQH